MQGILVKQTWTFLISVFVRLILACLVVCLFVFTLIGGENSVNMQPDVRGGSH